MKDLSGTRLGSYTLARKLGQGGMGAVYESYQSSMRRKVAIKVLPLHLANEEGYLERFNREVELAARMEHPHILPVYDYGMEQGLHYIVMRLLAGGSLEDRIKRRGRPSLQEAIKALSQIASALDYAHRRGVVHRDLKPSNVMFDDEGNVYLTDFGIAKLLEAGTHLTGTGQVLGTPAYMSPEQWKGEAIDARVDVYALGVMSYHLLTGRMPFEAPTPYAMMHQHLTIEPPPPSSVIADLPPAINQILGRALAKNVEQRYPTCDQFISDLRRAVGGLQYQGPEFTGFLTNVTPPYMARETPGTFMQPRQSSSMTTPAGQTPSPWSQSSPTAPPGTHHRMGQSSIGQSGMRQSSPSQRMAGAPTRISGNRRRTIGLLTLAVVGILIVAGAIIGILMQGGDKEPQRVDIEDRGSRNEPANAFNPLASANNADNTDLPATLPNTSLPTNQMPAPTSIPSTQAQPTVLPSATPELETRIALYATQTASFFTPTHTPNIVQTEAAALAQFYLTQTAAAATSTFTPSPFPTRTPTLFPTRTPTSIGIDTSRACPGSSLPPRITPGSRAWVLSQPPQPNTLRASIGLSSRRLGSIQPGEDFYVLSGPVCGDGLNWYEVRTSSGQIGWTAEGGNGYYWIGPQPNSSNLPTGSSASVSSVSCPGAPPTFFSVGDIAQVDFNRGGKLVLTSTPDGSGGDEIVLDTAYDNDRLEIIGGPVCGWRGDRWRWQVRNLTTGLSGWASEGISSDKWMCPLSDPECGF